MTWGWTRTVWSCFGSWPPSSETVAVRLYIIMDCGCTQKHGLKSHIANSARDEAQSSSSNTMIACLSLLVVRVLHQPTALMAACHTKVAHFPSVHPEKKSSLVSPSPFPSFFFNTLQTGGIGEKRQKKQRCRENSRYRKGNGENGKEVCVSVNRSAEYLMGARTTVNSGF